MKRTILLFITLALLLSDVAALAANNTPTPYMFLLEIRLASPTSVDDVAVGPPTTKAYNKQLYYVQQTDDSYPRDHRTTYYRSLNSSNQIVSDFIVFPYSVPDTTPPYSAAYTTTAKVGNPYKLSAAARALGGYDEYIGRTCGVWGNWLP